MQGKGRETEEEDDMVKDLTAESIGVEEGGMECEKVEEDNDLEWEGVK